MDRFVIQGGQRLSGEVQVGGAKNSVLPIMAAALLTDEELVIRRVPRLRDVASQVKVLQSLGARVLHDEQQGILKIRCDDEAPITAPYELMKTMRASICVLGPLLAKRKRARVSMPGGCVIGVRPIDLHLRGMEQLGAAIDVRAGYVEASTTQLRGSTLFLGSSAGSTVLGTANVVMAATLADGETVLENSAQEPEVVDLCNVLVKMGAQIDGIGSHCLRITGVKKLHGVDHAVIPDRIEAGTFAIAGAITGGDVTVRGCEPRDLLALIERLRAAAVDVTYGNDWIRVCAPRRFRSIDVTTLPHPGFPTDLQAQLMALLCLADGISMLHERIYQDRFIHVAELHRMGARIRKEGSTAIIEGVARLSGAPVMASDLRGSAALVLAGMAAEGETAVDRVYHIDRGYERIDERLRLLGAKIDRCTADVPPLSMVANSGG
ncbi:MAG: UDP-N-acetylglucosamine 1-carboxyvinyltransferase [Planctomycetes bacterium]|nr:UDP-N-acetylglucosamine 1-carboxyvinyltransferase [Planctomycetota bacterium]